MLLVISSYLNMLLVISSYLKLLLVISSYLKLYPINNNNNNLGFVFSTLKDKHPEKLEKLTELKQHLLDNNNDMAPMKVIGLIWI